VTDKYANKRQSSSKPLLGIFGGTFDPIHHGHLGAVSQIAEQLELDSLQWVLSAKPPHKDQVTANTAHRFEMLKLALKAYPGWHANDLELQRDAPSYTYDSLVELQTKHPDHQLLMIIGGDSFQTLSSWYRYPELLDLAHWVVMSRPGYKLEVPAELSARIVQDSADLHQSAKPKIWIHRNSHFDVSSTQLRRELTQSSHSEWVQQQVPTAVLSYIHQHQLYKIPGMIPEQIKNEVVEALEDIKGHDIAVLDIAEVSGFADYMVVVSGTSDTHVKALAREASDRLRKQNVKPLNEDGADLGEWVLVDFGDVVLHVMRPEVRTYYDLETLWDTEARAKIEQSRQQASEQSD